MLQRKRFFRSSPETGSKKITSKVLDRLADELNTDIEGVLKTGGVDPKAAKELEHGQGALDSKVAKQLRQHLGDEVDQALEGGIPFSSFVAAQEHKGYRAVKREGGWRVQDPSGKLIPGKPTTEAKALRQAEAINIKVFAKEKAKSGQRKHQGRDDYTYGPYQKNETQSANL